MILSFNKRLFRKKEQNHFLLHFDKKWSYFAPRPPRQTSLLGCFDLRIPVEGVLNGDFFTIASFRSSCMKTRQPSSRQFAFNCKSKSKKKNKNAQPQRRRQKPPSVTRPALCLPGCGTASRIHPGSYLDM